MLSSCPLPSAFCLALGKVLFTEGLLPSTRQRACLPSIEFQALGRVYFAECKRKKTLDKGPIECTRQSLYRVLLFCRVFFGSTRQRGVCRVPNRMHLVNFGTLGKQLDSDSVQMKF